jgi:type I restriction enzyme S subunit
MLGDGDILLAMTGATAGKVGRLRTAHPILLNQRVAKIQPVDVDPVFLWSVVRSREYERIFFRLADGAAQPNMSGGQIESVLIPLPPAPIQRSIASILGAYDDLIENNTRRIAILEEMARRLFDEWFVHFHFPGHDMGKLVESPLGLVPGGWVIQAIGDTFDVLGGGTPSKPEAAYWTDGSLRWFTPTDLTGSRSTFLDDSADHITERGLRESSARLFPAWCIMMTSRATLGVFAINTESASTNQGFITCVPNKRVPLFFLLHWLKVNASMFESHASGATFKEVTKGTFKRLPILLPPDELVRKYEAYAKPLMMGVLALQRAIDRLRQSRDLLLPRLISGEIDLTAAGRLPEAAD